MPSVKPSSDGGGQERSAESVYEEYLGRRDSGEKVDLEEYCRRHPDLQDALRALDSMERSPSGAGGPEPREADIRLPLPGLDLHPGDTIGPYKIISPLGEGGFGAVFLAEQEAPLRRKVALKVIKLGMDTKEVLARFEAERQALALMSHPGIARVYDAGMTALGRPYFVMEYVSGEPINLYCDRHRMDVAGRLRLFLEVCASVQHAHQ